MDGPRRATACAPRFAVPRVTRGNETEQKKNSRRFAVVVRPDREPEWAVGRAPRGASRT
jgi:hypothetical protein